MASVRHFSVWLGCEEPFSVLFRWEYVVEYALVQNTFFFVVIFLTMESLKLQHFHYARKGNSMAKAPVFKCFEEFNENSDQTKWESYSAQLEKVKKLQKQIRDLKKFSTVGNTKEK